VTERRRILLDTDLAMGAPGSDIDDGFALALALADPGIRLDLVTTVGGNTDVDTATALSAQLLERLGRDDVPVVRGAGRPLRGSGPAGRGTAPRRHAAVEIAERVLAAPGELTLVAIGPLTNVALALLLAPEVAGGVREIVIMGGVYLRHTNIAALPGEFNMWCDPEAADVVFTSGAPLRCVGLDVTTRVRLTDDDAGRMAASGRPFGAFAGACTREWIAHWDRTNPGATEAHGSCALHDPLAVAAVTRPELLSWRPAHVAVETQGRHTRGVTVADLGTVENPPAANCEIAVDVDVEGFREHFLSRLAGL
jgi:purine nucleosidase